MTRGQTRALCLDSSRCCKHSKREQHMQEGQIKMLPVADSNWPQALKCPHFHPASLRTYGVKFPLGWRSSTVWFVRCFIFHCIPLLLRGCTPASLKLILWAGGGLTGPHGHSLLDHRHSQLVFLCTSKTKSIWLSFVFAGRGGDGGDDNTTVCFVFFRGWCSCCLRYCAV